MTQLIGTQISHYQVQRLLGQGGMGEVYEAVDSSLGRRVAIKVLLPRFAADPEIIGRFFNEARSVNLISHPGLVQAYEFGQLPTGGAFMVMEYIDGKSLRDRLIETPRLGEMQALQIVLQLASALAATHAKDIVHRDLKPANVMILKDPTMPTGERVKLLDFGIAKLGAQSGAGEQPRTRTGLAIGTPTYMSPEQCRGSKSLDSKADVYSLGVMLYQLLAGRLPFEGESEGEVLGKHMYEEPPPLLKVAPEVSRPVAALTHRMLRKRPEERPSAQELVEVLTEMAAAVVPATARPSTKLQIVAASTESNQWEPLPKSMLPQFASTLGKSVGEFAAPRSVRLRLALLRFSERWEWLAKRTTPRQRLFGMAAGALLVSISVVIGLVAALRSPVAPTTVAVPAPPKVRWQLRSTPAGASVIRKQDQAVLGQTPWTFEQPAAAGTLDVVLRLEGYKDRALLLDQGRDVLIAESLEAEPSPAVGSKAVTDKKSSRRHGKGEKVEKVEEGAETGKKPAHGKRSKFKIID